MQQRIAVRSHRSSPNAVIPTWYFPAGTAPRMIPTMDDPSHWQSRAILLADLASTRADLTEIYASTLGRLSAARSAQWIAATGGFSADTRFDLGVGGTPISPAELAASIKQIESEATRVRELLAQVDAGLAEVSPAARGAVH